MNLTINGSAVEVDDRHAKTPLLWVLRDVLGMHGTKFGCEVGYSAACHHARRLGGVVEAGWRGVHPRSAPAVSL